MSPSNSPPKIGAGHASAMFRQGLNELRAAVFTESNIAQPPEYGLYGVPLPSEIAEANRAASRSPEGDAAGPASPAPAEQQERIARERNDARVPEPPQRSGPDMDRG